MHTVIDGIVREFSVIEPEVIKRAQTLTQMGKKAGLKIKKTAK